VRLLVLFHFRLCCFVCTMRVCCGLRIEIRAMRFCSQSLVGRRSWFRLRLRLGLSARGEATVALTHFPLWSTAGTLTRSTHTAHRAQLAHGH
jgi:hypothetical protein